MDYFLNLHLNFDPQMLNIWIHIMLHFLSNIFLLCQAGKKTKIPSTLWFLLCHNKNRLLYWHLTLGCLFGNLLPFPGWFLDSPYKFIAQNVLSVCAVRSFFFVCWAGFWLLLPICSSCLSNFTDDVASPCCYTVFFASRLKRTCLETWMSAILWNWCSVCLPGLYLIRKPQ